MRRFDYFAPASITEAINIMSQRGPGGKFLAGGTDLLVQMREAGLAPKYLVSLRNLVGLRDLRYDPKAGLTVGSLVTMDDLVTSRIVREEFAILAQGAQLVGSMQIKNLATIGGNLCNAAPSADTAPPLIALDAQAKIAGPDGQRTVPLEDFFVGPGQTVLGPAELLTEIVVPTPPRCSGGCYMRHTPRAWMDIAVVGVASFVVLDEAGACRDVRIVLGAVAPTPLRARGAEELLRGRALSDVAIEEAARRASEEAKPISDIRASAEYRRHLVSVLTRRTLRRALADVQKTVN